jgi:hypothetical protein
MNFYAGAPKWIKHAKVNEEGVLILPAKESLNDK